MLFLGLQYTFPHAQRDPLTLLNNNQCTTIDHYTKIYGGSKESTQANEAQTI